MLKKKLEALLFSSGRKMSIEAVALSSKKRMGGKRSDETKRKMRISAINRMKRTFGNKFHPNINPNEKEFFENLENEKKWNGIFHGKNDKQYLIEYLGYWVDYYEPIKNIVVEYDETNHYDKNWNLKEKDLKRQQEIIGFLKCEFYRYNEPLQKFYKII